MKNYIILYDYIKLFSNLYFTRRLVYSINLYKIASWLMVFVVLINILLLIEQIQMLKL